jgi:hypothetical protein
MADVTPFDAILDHMRGEKKPMYTQVINTCNILFFQGGITHAQLATALTTVQAHMEQTLGCPSYLEHVAK